MRDLISEDELARLQAAESLKKAGKEPAYKGTTQKIVLAVIVQLVILVSFAAKRAYTINTGTVITLHANTVDPFDTFRGDYVSLNYDIAKIAEVKPFKDGEQIYTVLEKDYPYWKLVGRYYNKPELKASQVLIKGKADYGGHINLGIETYYVPEGEGKKLERKKDLLVEVAVDNTGCAMVKSVVPQ